MTDVEPPIESEDVPRDAGDDPYSRIERKLDALLYRIDEIDARWRGWIEETDRA